MDAGGGGADEQHTLGLLALQGSGRGGLGLLHLLLHLHAVGLIQICPAGDIGAGLQHPQIVLKAVDVEIQHLQPGALQRFLQLHLVFGVGAGDDQIGLQAEEGLGADFLIAAQIRDALVQAQVKVLPGVLGGGDQLAAGQEPRLGKAAHEHRHPLRPGLQRDLPLQIVLDGHGRPFGALITLVGIRRLGGLGAAGRQQQGAQQRRQNSHVLFHDSLSSAVVFMISCRSTFVSSGSRGLPFFNISSRHRCRNRFLVG